MLAHLGYPQYFANILGAWQLAAAAALIAPGLPLVKEWAYAGVLFCSWFLRPSHSRLPSRTPATQISIWAWIVPVIILGLMLAVARFTLPETPKF